jgi:hypothetical protein
LSLLPRDVSEAALNLLSAYFVCRFLSQKRDESTAIMRGEKSLVFRAPGLGAFGHK